MYTRSTRGGKKIKMHDENLLGQKMNKKHYYALLVENNNFQSFHFSPSFINTDGKTGLTSYHSEYFKKYIESIIDLNFN